MPRMTNDGPRVADAQQPADVAADQRVLGVLRDQRQIVQRFRRVCRHSGLHPKIPSSAPVGAGFAGEVAVTEHFDSCT